MMLSFFRFTLAFTFGDLLRKDLDDFMDDWNSHPIRKNKHVVSVNGCPDDIYEMPGVHG